MTVFILMCILALKKQGLAREILNLEFFVARVSMVAMKTGHIWNLLLWGKRISHLFQALKFPK